MAKLRVHAKLPGNIPHACCPAPPLPQGCISEDQSKAHQEMRDNNKSTVPCATLQRQFLQQPPGGCVVPYDWCLAAERRPLLHVREGGCRQPLAKSLLAAIMDACMQRPKGRVLDAILESDSTVERPQDNRVWGCDSRPRGRTGQGRATWTALLLVSRDRAATDREGFGRCKLSWEFLSWISGGQTGRPAQGY